MTQLDDINNAVHVTAHNIAWQMARLTKVKEQHAKEIKKLQGQIDKTKAELAKLEARAAEIKAIVPVTPVDPKPAKPIKEKKK